MEERVDAENVCLVMKKKYDKEFHLNIEKVLSDLWNDVKERKRSGTGIVLADKRYVDYLEENGIVKNLNLKHHGDQWTLQLTAKGYEVFEKYGGWANYKRKVIDNKRKVDKAKELAIKYWWLTLVLSVISLVVAIIALII